MENGMVQAYNAKTARTAFLSMPPFQRTNQAIQAVELIGNRAVTLDPMKR